MFQVLAERLCTLDSENISFLMDVDLPPYCFLSEAIEWMALGRVPQMQHNTDGYEYGPIDNRFYWRAMPDNFEPSFEYPWFDRSEFESLGIPVIESYFDAAEKCVTENVHGLPELIADYERRETKLIQQDDGSVLDLWAELAVEAREKLERLEPLQALVDKVECEFQRHYDIAWAKLFQLLATGKIQCEAINLEYWDECADLDDYEKAARFDVIPAEAFSIGFDWRQDQILVKDICHVAMRISIKDVLENRTHLLQAGKAISVQRFGAFCTSSNAARSSFRRKRGRPMKVNWGSLAEQLAKMVVEDTTPVHKESCIFELVTFAEKELGITPSRTSVQRNLGSELDAIYARK